MINTKEDGKKFMRLYNIYFICKTCLPSIENVHIVEIRNSGNMITGYRLSGWGDCRKALASLKKIGCLNKIIDELCNTLNFMTFEKDTPEVAVDTGRKFRERFVEVKCSVRTIVNMYESMELGKSNVGIDVKIPKCDSLKTYMEYLKEIDFIFSQCPYLSSSDEEIKFNNVDVGSQWLSFVLITAGTFGVLNNLAKLIEKAVAIKSHLETLKQQDEMLKTMQLKNEVTEETIDVFKSMKRITMKGYVKELEAELGELKDGEERGKVEKSLEKLSTLLDKGVEIYSSIETPNEIKVLFPASEDTPVLPDNLVKYLVDKESNE